MSEHKSLAEALAAFQGEDGLTFPKTKTARVKSQRTGGEYTYTYADLADILPVVRPLLAKHGLSWTAMPTRADDGELVLRYRLLHGSGEAEQAEMPLGVDKGCKPQELGSAITYARRYALTAQLNLATEEDDDGNAAQAANGRTQVSAPRTTAQPAEKSEAAATPNQRAAINARMGQAGASENEAKAILQWKCGTEKLDRVPKKTASQLIETLGEDGSGALDVLNLITAAADEGDARAVAIRSRYFEPVTT